MKDSLGVLQLYFCMGNECLVIGSCAYLGLIAVHSSSNIIVFMILSNDDDD